MQYMEAFYEGLFSAMSKQQQPGSNEHNSKPNYPDITAYLSADIVGDKIKLYFVEYNDKFGENLEDFINHIEHNLQSTQYLFVEFKDKAYKVLKEEFVKIIKTLNEVFSIAKTKFEEAMHNNKDMIVNFCKNQNMTLDMFRQSLFITVAYTANNLKLVFAGAKLQQESINYERLQNYSRLSIAYFIGKIFDDVKIESYDYFEKNIVREDLDMMYFHDPTSQYGQIMQHDQFIQQVNHINHMANNIDHSYHTHDYTSINQNLNEYKEIINNLYANKIINHYNTDINTAIHNMIIDNDFDTAKLDQINSDLTKLKSSLLTYQQKLELIYNNNHSPEVHDLIEKTHNLINDIDNSIERVREGYEIAKTIERYDLLGDEVFKSSLKIAATIGLLHMAYRIAKGCSPLAEFLKIRLSILLFIVILFVVKYLVEHYYQLKMAIMNMHNSPDLSMDIISHSVFIVAIGLIFGSIVYRKLNKPDQLEIKQMGSNTGKILTTV